MSAEAAILEAVARVAVSVFGPMIEAALRSGEPEEAVVARLTALAAPVVRNTTAEDAARRQAVCPHTEWHTMNPPKCIACGKVG